MKHAYRTYLIILIVVIMGPVLFSLAMAQEEIYRLEYTDILGKLRRPAIDFAHEDHVAALDNQGCGACHHAPDAETGQLVYMEDEEVSCSECHGAAKDDTTPALREAFHGNCTLCHRRMGKSTQDFKGPTTCGECHTPQ